jgi:RNA recognition motif-containing protein
MNIYVGNLGQSVTEEALRSLFAAFGAVDSIRIIKDKFTGSPRGFAFVEMSNSEEAGRAIEQLNGAELEGQRIRVNEARPPQARPSHGGGRPRHGGGGFGGPRGGGRGGFGGDRFDRGGGRGGRGGF